MMDCRVGGAHSSVPPILIKPCMPKSSVSEDAELEQFPFIFCFSILMAFYIWEALKIWPAAALPRLGSSWQNGTWTVWLDCIRQMIITEDLGSCWERDGQLNPTWNPLQRHQCWLCCMPWWIFGCWRTFVPLPSGLAPAATMGQPTQNPRWQRLANLGRRGCSGVVTQVCLGITGGREQLQFVPGKSHAAWNLRTSSRVCASSYRHRGRIPPSCIVHSIKKRDMKKYLPNMV